MTVGYRSVSWTSIIPVQHLRWLWLLGQRLVLYRKARLEWLAIEGMMGIGRREIALGRLRISILSKRWLVFIGLKCTISITHCSRARSTHLAEAILVERWRGVPGLRLEVICGKHPSILGGIVEGGVGRLRWRRADGMG